MGKIRDYNCVYNGREGVSTEVLEKSGIKFPEVYFDPEKMAALSILIKEHNGDFFCALPFCHTLEAEAMGGSVTYGNALAPPRARTPITNELGDILCLPSIDYSAGRIQKVLLSCNLLCGWGEEVVLRVSSPMTILCVLMDIRDVLRGMKKEPELFFRVLWKLGDETLEFVHRARECGVRMVSWADPVCGPDILGPRRAKWVIEGFTEAFLKRLSQEMGKRMVLLLCPRTTYALSSLHKVEFAAYPLADDATYGQGCLWALGKLRIVGEMCLKDGKRTLKDGRMKEIVFI